MAGRHAVLRDVYALGFCSECGKSVNTKDGSLITRDGRDYCPEHAPKEKS